MIWRLLLLIHWRTTYYGSKIYCLHLHYCPYKEVLGFLPNCSSNKVYCYLLGQWYHTGGGDDITGGWEFLWMFSMKQPFCPSHSADLLDYKVTHPGEVKFGWLALAYVCWDLNEPAHSSLWKILGSLTRSEHTACDLICMLSPMKVFKVEVQVWVFCIVILVQLEQIESIYVSHLWVFPWKWTITLVSSSNTKISHAFWVPCWVFTLLHINHRGPLP